MYQTPKGKYHLIKDNIKAFECPAEDIEYIKNDNKT